MERIWVRRIMFTGMAVAAVSLIASRRSAPRVQAMRSRRNTINSVPPSARANYTPVAIQQLTPQSGISDFLITFELPAGNRMLNWPDRPLPEVVLIVSAALGGAVAPLVIVAVLVKPVPVAVNAPPLVLISAPMVSSPVVAMETLPVWVVTVQVPLEVKAVPPEVKFPAEVTTGPLRVTVPRTTG